MVTGNLTNAIREASETTRAARGVLDSAGHQKPDLPETRREPNRILLVIDDALDVTEMLVKLIEKETGRPPVVAPSLIAASRVISDGTRMYGAVSDFCLPDGEPIMLLAALCERGVPPCVFTAYPDLARNELEQAARKDPRLLTVPVFSKPQTTDLLAWVRDVRRKDHDSGDKGRTP